MKASFLSENLTPVLPLLNKVSSSSSQIPILSSVLLEVKQVASGGIVIIAGLILFFLLLIAGHIAVVMGLIKRSAELQNSQNSDLIEIRDNVRKLLDNTRTSKNEEKVL